MNIPEIYLVEPYNPYAPKGRKKHWHEVIEEQALMARLIAEQQALQEAQSKTLPNNSPDISSPTVGNMNAGAGGMPVVDFFHPEADVVNFSATPLVGAGPLTVQFSNLTTTPYLDSYTWNFGDGTTSTDVNPSHVYQSGSAAGYTVQLTASYTQGSPNMTSSVGYISASIPAVVAAFTFTTSSNVAPFTASFTNTSTNSSQTPIALTYQWIFNNATTTSSSLTNPVVTVNSGSFTASLQATGSYGIASRYTQSFYSPLPTLTAAFTFNSSSDAAPTTMSFVDSTTYNGSGTKTYLWTYGSGSISSSLATPPSVIFNGAGGYTGSLQVTESIYSIASSASYKFTLS